MQGKLQTEKCCGAWYSSRGWFGQRADTHTVHGLDPGGKIQKLPEPKRRSASEIYPDAKGKARANSERKFRFLPRRFRQSRQTDGSDLTAGWLLIKACARG